MQRYLFTQTISNAFSEAGLRGNPAATVVLEMSCWLPDVVMQAIAEQNNLPETTFILPAQDELHIRWFTPEREVYLAGHATLAAAHCLAPTYLSAGAGALHFRWKDGQFSILRDERSLLWMEFGPEQAAPLDPATLALLGSVAGLTDGFVAKDTVLVLDSQASVSAFDPASLDLLALPGRGLAITARAARDDCDYVSRFFCPRYGVPEDPVTGSSHAVLAPFWARRLDADCLKAHQLSRRGGVVRARVTPGKVWIGGHVRDFSTSRCTLELPNHAY